MLNMRFLFVVLLALLFAVLGSAWLFGSNLVTEGYVHRTPEQGLHPRDEPPFKPEYWQGLMGDPKESIGLEFETVEFPAVDGSTLRGWLIPSYSNRAVVAVHGGESDRRSWLRQTPMLHSAGYNVLLFDMREHGISDGSGAGIAFGWRGHYDVSAAVAYMKKVRQYDRVAVMGTSMGAVSSIIAAARDKNIDLVIAENPFTSAVDVLGDADFFDKLPRWYRSLVAFFTRVHFGVMDEPNAIDVVGQISPRPLLLTHGTADQAVSVWQSEALYKAAGQPKELWVLEGATHAALFNTDPVAFEDRVVGFLQSHMSAGRRR